MNYQGHLTDNTPSQEPIDASLPMSFRIYGSLTGSDLLWDEYWASVDVNRGIFSVLLGSNGSPISSTIFRIHSTCYLQIEVDGDLLSPRQQLGAVGWANQADTAAELECTDCVDSSEIVNGTVTGTDVADGSIYHPDIANGTLSSADIASRSIIGGDIAAETITGTEIANGSVLSLDIGNGAVTGTDVLDGTITAADLAADAVGSAQIQDFGITGNDIASYAITSWKYADRSIDSVKLSNAFGLWTYTRSTKSTTESLLSIGQHPFCALTMVKFNAMRESGTNSWCRVFRQYEGGSWRWYLGARSNGITEMLCEAYCM